MVVETKSIEEEEELNFSAVQLLLLLSFPINRDSVCTTMSFLLLATAFFRWR